MRKREPKATIDTETRSAWNLKKSNSWVYSKHPSTEVMVLKYHIPGSNKIKMWHMAHPSCDIEESPLPQDLFDWIAAGGLVEAHNSTFERNIWRNVLVARRGWPKIKHEQWRCSAAKAAAHSLPRSLEGGLNALELDIEKDMEGHRLMLKLSKPRKPKKKELLRWRERHGDKPMPIQWNEDPDDIRRNWRYCGHDVRSEMALSDELDDLSPQELRIWQMDQRINERGVWCDRELVEAALKMARDAIDAMNEELSELTGGKCRSATKRQQVRKWLYRREALDLPDTKGETLDEFMEVAADLSDRARRVLEILRSANRTSTAKFRAMALHMDPDDDRIRCALLYCGADRTGRWSGRGVQPHNFPRGSIKGLDMEQACADVKTGDLAMVAEKYGDPMELLSSILRGALGAAEGDEIAVADFAAIEARVVFWLADATAALRAFRKGVDIYCDLASTIYRIKVNKDDHPGERFLGKQGILGLGFGMGFPKFLQTVRKYKVSFTQRQVRKIVARYDETAAWMHTKGRLHLTKVRDISLRRDLHELVLMKYIVDVYRNKYPEVVSLWGLQEDAAVMAMQNPGKRYRAGKLSWRLDGRFLRCRLPSGRSLHYFDPEVRSKKNPWGGTKECLTYMGVHPKTKRWGRVDTYGGKLTENAVQAVARDIMAHGMLVTHYGKNPFRLVLSVHDELMADFDRGSATSKQFVKLMTTMPEWAEGCPVEAVGWTGKRYQKK